MGRGHRPYLPALEKATASARLLRGVPGGRLVNVDDLPLAVPSDEYPGLVVAPDGRSLGGGPGEEQGVAANGAIAVDLLPVVRQLESLAGLLPRFARDTVPRFARGLFRRAAPSPRWVG